MHTEVAETKTIIAETDTTESDILDPTSMLNLPLLSLTFLSTFFCVGFKQSETQHLKPMG